ncbi:D-sedoheptulose-7-phosphate isomerase [Streptomyces prasinopilosus]|uniref:D-sedoheptulose 7-phosphate isomerase n=1 Tax=Streptomyces prasinopilosus TaxID=67344 RepID=A0A1G6M2C9_9ACTN|nr:SIS domain-containing protein [Streptomyces prasinopilosus]SDC49683.1 D-sedoheptulose 7-phosphate isomerase [Streptomyces prasinopilosus]
MGNEGERRTESDVREYIRGILRAVGDLSLRDVVTMAHLFEEAYDAGRTVFTCGNGGSAATASHLAIDLAKNTRYDGAPPLRAHSLVDHVSALTAWANDVGYEAVFSGQLEGFVEPGDIVVGISTSGNSPNVLNALRTARKIGARPVGLLGPTGGQAAELCDHWIAAPAHSIEEQEDVHMSLAHILTRHMRTYVRNRASLLSTTGGVPR